MFVFTILAGLFSREITQVVENTRIDGVKCTVILSSDKTFAIGDGKKNAFSDVQNSQKTISIPEQIKINQTTYKLVNISDYAFKDCSFKNITLPNLQNSKIQFLRLGAHCFEQSHDLVEISFIKSKVRIIPQYCFAGCRSLQIVHIDISTETFEKYAFFQSGIKEIKIRAHITTIGKYCFAESDVEYVEMSSSLFEALPRSFFEGCKKLKEVSLPKQLVKLPRECFNQSGIQTVILPATLKQIGESCFYNCTRLQKIEFNHTQIKEFPKSCFEHCYTLSVIFCPRSLESIADYALSDTGIAEFYAPKTLKHLGTGFIQMCGELTEVSLKEVDLPVIPSYSFYRCTKLRSFTPPDNMVAVEEYAFSDTLISKFPFASLERVSLASFAQCKNLLAADLSNVKSPRIPKELFHKCSSLKTIKFPRGDLRIGELAFCGTAITTLTFPSVVQIDDEAFKDCTSLTKVDLSYSKCELYSYKVFSGCGDIYILWPTAEVNFRLGKKLFDSSKITRVILPAQCTEIEEGCFKHCLDLSIVDLEKTSITSIPKSCFESTGELDIIWPKTITTIEREAFIQCNIRELKLPPTLKEIKEAAFSNCKNLKSVNFGNSQLTTIPDKCFHECSKLEEIKWNDKITTIGDEAFAQSKLRKIELPEKITKIGEGVFSNSADLKIVDLSYSSITEIPTKAFSGCTKINSILLPKGIKTIGSNAFEKVNNVKEIYYPGKESDGKDLKLPKSKIYVSNEYPGTTFAGVEVTKQDSFEPEDDESLKASKEADEEQNPMVFTPQFEESHTTRNAVICVIIVVFICVVIWFKCDPYGVNGSEGVELEGELPWYRQIIQKIGFKMDQMSSRAPQFNA